MTSTQRLVSAVAARLESELPPLVAAEDLPPILQFLDYDPPLASPALAPQVWVVLASLAPGRRLAFGGTGGKFTRDRRLQVVVTTAGNELGMAVSRLYAYSDLILQVMYGEMSLGGEATDLRWTGTSLSPSFPGGKGALFKASALTFEVERWSQLGTD